MATGDLKCSPKESHICNNVSLQAKRNLLLCWRKHSTVEAAGQRDILMVRILKILSLLCGMEEHSVCPLKVLSEPVLLTQ